LRDNCRRPEPSRLPTIIIPSTTTDITSVSLDEITDIDKTHPMVYNTNTNKQHHQVIIIIIFGLTSVSPHSQFLQGRRHRFSMLNMGWTGPLTTVRVLEQNFMSDALPDATPVETGDPVFGREPSSWRKHQLARQREQTTAYSTVQ